MSKLTIERVSGRDVDPGRWDEFLMASPQGALWMLHGYASIIAPDWEAFVISDRGDWHAVVPFTVSDKIGILRTLQPKFAQYWGVCFRASGLPAYEDLSWQKEILELLIGQLGEFRHLVWYCSPRLEYFLPFVWAGFSVSPRVTFQVDLSLSEQELMRQAADGFRRNVKKGRKSLSLEVDADPEVLERLLKKQHNSGREIIGENDNDWRRIGQLMRYLTGTGSGSILAVRNDNNRVVAAGLFATYQKQTMYLLGTFNPDITDHAAMPTLMWEAMMRAMEAGSTVFDFEGSMIPGVERFFRRAGGRPVSYLQLEKNDLPIIIKWINALRS